VTGVQTCALPISTSDALDAGPKAVSEPSTIVHAQVNAI